jgi:hypothetical protein
MPSPEFQTLGATKLRVVITIPANSGNGDLISTLASLTASQQARVMAVRIHKTAPNSATARGAFHAGPSAATWTASEYIAEGEHYTDDGAAFDALNTYVRSASASTVSALAIFTLANADR